MSISLYDATVKGFLPHLQNMIGVLDKAEAHCREKGGAPQSLLSSCLYEDMWPLTKQINSVVHHSEGAIRLLSQGQFTIPPAIPDGLGFSDLKAMLADARQKLEKVTPADVEALEGKNAVFVIRDMEFPIEAREFLLAFSVPNFHFHCTTAYGILRMNGVQLGKMDYMGRLPTRPV